MSQNLAEKQETVHVAKIEYHADKLLIPNGMSIPQAIRHLKDHQQHLEQKVEIRHEFNYFPWDGANALAEVLVQRYGWAASQSTPGFFGDQPPSLINIKTDFNSSREVPWGRFGIPGIDVGYIETNVAEINGRMCFSLRAIIQRKDEAEIRQLFEMVDYHLKNHSIYQGKAIKIRFYDEDGDKIEMPQPEFIDTSHISRDMLIYSDAVQQEIEVNLFTPIERVADCLNNDIAVKRGVLLGGPYGTGKTLAATVASRIAVDNGVTYLYVPHADELAEAIQFAKQYQEKACVIFCEDIDRTVTGERSVEMDDILNIIDGIDTKNSRIITVLTTNHLENINPAMLRPGRLDAVINVQPPNAEAVVRLIKHYAGDALEANTDLSAAAELLDGTIPAVIAEVVKRSKLVQMSLQAKGSTVNGISGEAILKAAQSMQYQIDLLREMSKPKKAAPTLDDHMTHVLKTAMNGAKEAIMESKDKIGDLHRRIM